MEPEGIFCSFLVPVYNAEPYLRSCLDSIFTQTDHDFELILVDDGSTDGSGAICDGYAGQHSRVRAIHQKHAGHTAARNAGLAAAQGRYIAFVDSDDWIDPTLLEDCHQAALEACPDVILFGYRRVRSNTTMEKPQPCHSGFYDRAQIQRQILPTLLTDGRFSLCERLVRRELLVKYQFNIDKRIIVGEDLACCVCCVAAARNLYVLPGIYYNYAQHDGSVIHSYQNYTFENWEILRGYLANQLAEKIPNFWSQLGTCSIRLLYMAVLGEISRKGLSRRTAQSISHRLMTRALRQDVQLARIPAGKKALRFKRFCLKHRLIYVIFLSNWLRPVIHKVRRSL